MSKTFISISLSGVISVFANLHLQISQQLTKMGEREIFKETRKASFKFYFVSYRIMNAHDII